MLLGLSGQNKDMDVSYEAVNGSDAGDGGVPHGALLARLAEAMWEGDREATAAARAAVVDAASADVMVDAVAVSANFHMMTRVADGTGTPLDPGTYDMSAPVREACDLNGFVSRRDPQGDRQTAQGASS
ncbi:MAG: hypothetical protein F4Y76_11010 [Acidimicrobiales bacterium]|nr:hypothetical protein [Acidimicrobiales bacterium]MYG61684.1 hypothetical protein [Acidimicrobiales bacterium]